MQTHVYQCKYDSVKTMINPTPLEIKNYMKGKAYSCVRWIEWEGDLYVWDAYEGCHFDMVIAITGVEMKVDRVGVAELVGGEITVVGKNATICAIAGKSD